MLFEYAVEPQAIGSSWHNFRYLIEKFGFDRGRLISRFPDKWEKKVIQAAKDAGVPDVRMASIIERLKNSKARIVDFARSYDPDKPWIDNARLQHAAKPFRAIVGTGASQASKQYIAIDDCTDENELFRAPISVDVPRTAAGIAGALKLIGKAAKEIEIVDPFFDLRPGKGDYIGPLAAIFAALSGSNSPAKVITVHFRTHESPPPDHLLATQLGGLTAGKIPPGYQLQLIEWAEITGGEDFHDRFLFTDIGGLMVGAGFAATSSNETAVLTLLDDELARNVRARFDLASAVYAKIGKTVEVDSSGKTSLI